MKPKRNRLQAGVLRRLEAGLPPTHWQQFRLHLQTAWRRRGGLTMARVRFHAGGLLRIVWMPIPLLRLAGVPVQLHPTCFVYPIGCLALLAWLNPDRKTAALLLLLLVVSATGLLVHEFAHVLMARYLGIGTRRVVFLPFGAVAELGDLSCGRCELAVAAAGPLASLALAGDLWLAHLGINALKVAWLHPADFCCELGVVMNLVLALFNLLPCFPMDGGRILRSLLAILMRRMCPTHVPTAGVSATKVAVRYVAWPVAAVMMALTITFTHIWLHLLLFPLLLVAAELEYLRVREEPDAV